MSRVTRNVSFPPSGSPSYSPTELPVYRGGGAWSPLSLGDKLLAWYDPSDLTTLFQDSAGTTPVTAAGQPVGLMLDKSGKGYHLTQATPTARWTYQTSPARVVTDALDDVLTATLPAITGGQIVAAGTPGTWIDGLTRGASTFNFGPTTYSSGPAGFFSLLSNGLVGAVILSDTMTTAERASMIAYTVSKGSAGEITLGGELKSEFYAEEIGLGTASYDAGTDVWSITRAGAGEGLGSARLAAAAGNYLATITWLSGSTISLRVNTTDTVMTANSGSPSIFTRAAHSSGTIGVNHGANNSASTFRINSVKRIVLP